MFLSCNLDARRSEAAGTKYCVQYLPPSVHSFIGTALDKWCRAQRIKDKFDICSDVLTLTTLRNCSQQFAAPHCPLQ